MTTQTQKYLESIGACGEARNWVGDKTLDEAWLVCERLDWLQWLVTAAALAEYERAEASAWAEYKRVTASTWAEYERVRAPALAEYERVTAAASAEYERVRAPAQSCQSCDELRSKFSCPEI